MKNAIKKYSPHEPPLSDIGNALVELISYIESKKKPGYLEKLEFLNLRDSAYQALTTDSNIPEEVIECYWRQYCHIIIEAIQLNYRLDAEMINRNSRKTSVLSDRTSAIIKKRKFKIKFNIYKNGI